MRAITKILSIILCLPCYLMAYDIHQEPSVVTKVRFETNDIDVSDIKTRLLPTNVNTALSSFNGSTYFIWVNADRQPIITKITEEDSVSYKLDPDPEYQVQADNHHTFSLGIDKDGFIHVVGDMHSYAPPREGYLPRFNHSTSMYWVSKAPEKIEDFVFTGNHPEKNLPLRGYTYCQFYNDLDMEMYLLCRVSHQSGFYPGIRGLGLAHYDAEQQRWHARGEIPQHPRATVKNILWEDNGSYSDDFPTPGYQGYQATMVFDHQNRMHIASTINNSNDYMGATHVVYAYSEDGGHHFYRADGSAIGALPMRVDRMIDEEGLSRQPDIVHESTSLSEYFWNFAGIYLNGKGAPSIGYWPQGLYKDGWTWINSWDTNTKTWTPHYDQPTAGGSQTLNSADANGIMTYFSTSSWGEIVRTTEDAKPPLDYKKTWTYRALSNLDRLALREEGVFRMVAAIIDDKVIEDENQPYSLQVVDINFKPLSGFTHEIWQNTYGNSLNALTAAATFPDSPSSQEYVAADLQTNANIGDSYGSRLRGMIHPPEDGNYEFWISGDNNSELWLSEDTSTWHAVKIAYVPGWSNPEEWYKYPQQHSAKIELKKDRRYYFEVVHKEGGGGDHVGVAWLRPSSAEPEIIAKQYLSPWFGSTEGAFK